MRIFLILILIFFINTSLIYGLRPSEREYIQEPSKEELSEISQEKIDIIESVTPVREERERQLHPFVQPVSVGEGLKPSPTTFSYDEDVRLRESPYADTRSRTEVKNPEPKRSINLIFLSLIAITFLLSYLFIRPKTK